MFVSQRVFPASHPDISPPLSWFMYPFHSLFSRTPSLTMILLLSHFFVSNRFCLILLRNGDLSFFAEGKLFPQVVSFKHPTCCRPNIWESGVSDASGKPLTLFARISSRLHTNNMAAHCSQDEQKQVSFV